MPIKRSDFALRDRVPTRGEKTIPRRLNAAYDQTATYPYLVRPMSKEPDMKDEYDFGGAARGKFYCPDAELKPRAEARSVSLSRLVNTLLKKDIELIRSAN